MKSIKLIGAEWKGLLTNRKILIPVLAVLFIPLLYSGMFLWAFWDPYDKLDELPVAVVNLDEGAEYEGRSLLIGDNLQNNLKENDGFMWEFVSQKEAYKGLENQHYYMVIEIPEDFSKRATTLLEEKPQAMELKYIPNESYNFLSSQIGATAVEQIKEEVSKELIRTYAETMFENIERMADGFKDAADGTNQMNDGVGELSSGSDSLMKGLEQAAKKTILFSNGLSSAFEGVKGLNEGNQQLANGLQQLTEGHAEISSGAESALAGMKELNQGLEASKAGMNKVYTAQQELANGANKLTEGAGQIAAGASELKAGTSQAKQEAERLSEGMQQLQQGLQPLLAEADAQQKVMIEAALQELVNGSAQFSQGLGVLNNSVSELQTGAEAYQTKLQQFAEGQKQAANGLSELVQGTERLTAGSAALIDGQSRLVNGIKVFDGKLGEANQGSEKLAQGSEQLLSGIGDLESGSIQFQSGTAELAEGSGKLKSGIDQLGDGTQELESKLAEAADKAGAAKGTKQTYDMFSEPVKVKSEVVNEVPNYGTGFAPYFLSLGLFVGALLLSIVYPLKEPAGAPSSGTSWFLSKLGVLAVVGVFQALLADAVLLFGLGIDVKSVPLFILFSIITSFTFISIIQLLVTTLGDPGRFVAIIILILQLTTSAGTFPLELIPNALQPFNLFLPMTYSVSGLKAVISSGDFSFMWHNAGILAIFLTVMLAGTWGYFINKFRKSYKMAEG